MKILIIHLSDIHIKSKKDSMFMKLDKLCDAFKNLCLDMDALFLLIAGDIAYSGTEEEYAHAMTLLDTIKTKVETYSNKTLNILMTPGNHDCNHKISKGSVRDALIDQIRNLKVDADDEIIEQCCNVQNEWSAFNDFYQDNEKLLFTDKLLRTFNYSYDSNNIIFNCYNTSWLSKKTEKPGIFFPTNRYSHDIFKNKADLIVSVFHHPISWQHIHLYRDFTNHLEITSDMVLTGHDHVTSKSKTEDFEGNSTIYLDAGMLQDHSNNNHSEFNVIQIDLAKQIHKIISYKWGEDIYSSSGDSTGWKPYQRLADLQKYDFNLNLEFKRFLTDAGASFLHPRKTEKLILEDFFIFPTLRDLNKEITNSSNVRRDVISSRFLQKLNDASTKIILMGAEKTGKTALCRTLYKQYLKNQHIPVLINGYDIKASSLTDIAKLIDKNFSLQYSKNELEKFNQLDNNEKVLIIDDFDKSRLNVKYKSVFLSIITIHYPHILITTNEFFPIEEILYEEDEMDGNIAEYRQYKILDFGYQLRGELINKWNTLGQEHYITTDELIIKNDIAEKAINSIIGRNYIPSLPIFLLTILQTIEAGETHNIKESSFGHYYSYLITQALTKLRINHEDLEAYYNYITELSFYMFTLKEREISEQNLIRFHERYCHEYSVNLRYEAISSNLFKSSILSITKEMVGFRYKYVYYYFVARYLSQHIDEPEIKKNISNLCERLHVEEFANIILFLTHHSKDKFILEEILSRAKSIFSEFDIVKFDKDTSFINNLLTEVPKLVYEEKDVKKHREIKAELKDKKKELKEIENEDNKTYDYEAGINELDIVSKLKEAFKTIEIVGQVLKNYYGSLKGPNKLELGEEAFFISLRALKSFFELLHNNEGLLVKDIISIIEQRKIVDKDKIENVARRVVFHLCEAVSFGVITKTAQSLGSEKLSVTFKKILENNNYPSVQLINTAIKLDFYKAFPYEDLKKIKSSLSSNYLPNVLLKRLVINYLYMFPASYSEKQKICSIVEIPFESSSRIDAKTTQRKKK